MVYNPGGRAILRTSPGKTAAQHQQLGYMDAGASVQRAATPMANNVNLLVNAVILNYMALHGDNDIAAFPTLFPNHGLGNIDAYMAFEPIVNGIIPPPAVP